MTWDFDIRYGFWKSVFENQLLWMSLVLVSNFALFALVWVSMCDHDFTKIKHLFHTWLSKEHKARVIPKLDFRAARL